MHIIVFIFVFLCLCNSSAHAEQRYAIQYLDSGFDLAESWPYAINDSGEVCGEYQEELSGSGRAFIWRPDCGFFMTEDDVYGGICINNKGEVFYTCTENGRPGSVIKWSPDNKRTVVGNFGAIVWCANDRDQLLLQVPLWIKHPHDEYVFILDQGKKIPLGHIFGTDFGKFFLNNRGEVATTISSDNKIILHSLNSGQTFEISCDGKLELLDLNNNGEMLCHYQKDGDSFALIGTIDGLKESYSLPHSGDIGYPSGGLNDQVFFVLTQLEQGYPQSRFLNNTGQLINIEGLVYKNGSPFSRTFQFVDLNNDGKIIGKARHRETSDCDHAFLLTPLQP